MQQATLTKQQAFTLIELVLVMVLVGILSAVIGPRLLKSDDITAIATRDSMVARLRLVQTMNMNEPKVQKTRLVFVSNVGAAHITEPIAEPYRPYAKIDNSPQWRRIEKSQLVYDLQGQDAFSISFDRLGKPLIYNADGISQENACAQGCVLSIADIQLRIESEGFIHAL